MSVVRIVSYNVAGAPRGLSTLATELRAVDADAYGLQELTRWRARALARRMFFSLQPGFRIRSGALVLCKDKPEEGGLVRLPIQGESPPRGLVWAVVNGVWVGAAHLGLRADERQRHARAIAERFHARGRAVLCVDLNEQPHGAAAQILLAGAVDAGAAAGATFPADAPTHRIDVVLVRGLEVVRAEVLPRGASDHRGVVVDVAD